MLGGISATVTALVVTGPQGLLVAASGISVAGIGAAFWALPAGLLVRYVTFRKVPASV